MPEHHVSSDGALVVRGQQRGHPVRARRSERRRSARTSAGPPPSSSARVTRRRRPAARARACRIRDPSASSTPGVGGLTVLREILRRSPHESTIYLGDNARAPYGTRTRRRGPAVLDRGARRARGARRQGARRRLQHLDRRRARRPARAATTCRSWASSGPAPSAAALATRNRRIGVIATPGDGPLPRVLQRDQGREPGGRGVRARDAALRAHGRGRELDGPRSRRPSRRSSRPLLGERDGAGEFVFPLPPSATIDTLLLGCTHYPLLRPVLARRPGRAGRDRGLGDGDRLGAGRAAVDQRARGARARPAGTAADPGRRRPRRGRRSVGAAARRTSSSPPATSTASGRIASRMFGEALPRRRVGGAAGARRR